MLTLIADDDRQLADLFDLDRVTNDDVVGGAVQYTAGAGVKAGVKPILGVEAYVAPGSRFDRQPGEDAEKYRHLTLLARNETGYRNLLKLVTDASIDGFYHRPRIDALASTRQFDEM